MRMDLALIIHFQNVKEGTVDQSMVSVKEFLRHQAQYCCLLGLFPCQSSDVPIVSLVQCTRSTCQGVIGRHQVGSFTVMFDASKNLVICHPYIHTMQYNYDTLEKRGYITPSESADAIVQAHDAN